MFTSLPTVPTHSLHATKELLTANGSSPYLHRLIIDSNSSALKTLSPVGRVFSEVESCDHIAPSSFCFFVSFVLKHSIPAVKFRAYHNYPALSPSGFVAFSLVSEDFAWDNKTHWQLCLVTEEDRKYTPEWISKFIRTHANWGSRRLVIVSFELPCWG